MHIYTARLLSVLLTTLSLNLLAQTPYTSADTRGKSYETRKNLLDNSLVKNIPFQSIGPTIMSGRVVDLAVSPDDPTHFYVAYASGGLWFTDNNGQSFTPLFDNEAVMTLGDIAVDWAHGGTIWLGTGENNSSRSSYAGYGIYKSTDHGQSWQHMGLPESHHIGRILVHPQDSNTVWVAALGHLYTPNKERGVYKSTDGGNTWTQTLFVDENSGVIDLVADPQNPDVLYAASWHRERRAWNFVESGDGSGIYKSTDGGDTWTLISTAKSGFPQGSTNGRIGLAVSHQNSDVVYAFLDNQAPKASTKTDSKKLTKDDLRTMSSADFLKLSDTDLHDYLDEYDFPNEYDAQYVKKMVADKTIAPIALVEYVEDANALLFSTPIKGAELYRSEDGGNTWKRTHDTDLDDLVFTYGYYFGLLRISPVDDQQVYLAGVPIIKSDDGGKTFHFIGDDNVHVDHHALWISPSRKGYIINGNDGGVNISYDDGKHWFKANSPAVGQFYTVNVDRETPYNVYGGLQDNGVWTASHNYQASSAWLAEGQYPYKSIMGGDGMQVEIDTRDNQTVYTGYQFGNYFRVNKTTGDADYIQPRHKLGERPLRFNWQTPIHLSRHNQDILYMGSNKLHRSMDQGNTFIAISNDLTLGGKTGDVAYGTLTSIHESPLKFGLIYTGSDDGKVFCTQDGGNNWTDISGGLPSGKWISRIQASAHALSRVYVSLNGYRDDDFSAYLFVSEDYGKTWQSISNALPGESINVIKEDLTNENILYVGTDHGLYVSLDKGNSYMALQGGMPSVPVHDVVIQPVANELVVATHGRSLYVAELSELQKLTSILDNTLSVSELSPVWHRKGWGNSWSKWMEAYEPDCSIPVYSKQASQAVISVQTSTGVEVNTWTEDLTKGIQYLSYNMSVLENKKNDYEKYLKNIPDTSVTEITQADNGAYYLLPGTYTVIIKAAGQKVSTELVVKSR